jgi:hypothetical protein
MSITFESAARLSALKSKIDSAVGSTSSTLSQAVDKAIEAAAAGGKKVYTGQFNASDTTDVTIDVGVPIEDFAILVISTGQWTTMGSTDVEVLVKMAGMSAGFRVTSSIDMGLPDYPVYIMSETYSTSLSFTESGFVAYGGWSLTQIYPYTWYLIQ